MSLDNTDQCPICKKNYQSAERLGLQNAYRISCNICGTYDVSRTAQSTLGGERAALLPFLTAHTRQNFEFDSRIVQINSDWTSLAEMHRHTSIHRRADKLLRLIESRTKQAGEFVAIRSDWDYPLVDAVNDQPLFYYLKYWEDLGCLEMKDLSHIRLTVKGWDRLDPASAGGGIPGRVFVAMWFDATMDDAYGLGILPAIEVDCDMKAVRIDKELHNEKICDRILAEIRRSQIVVADFTGHRGGVYFEAGFALALGRLVIWTCHSNAIKDAHFDTRQYPHIVWSDPADLRVRLADRIRALMPR